MSETIRVDYLVHVCEDEKTRRTPHPSRLKVSGCCLAGFQVSWRLQGQHALIHACPYCGERLPAKVETQWRPR